MSGHLDYFKEVHAQRQIDKLARKYKNKKVVIYGAGLYFRILKENFNLSKLNIVAIADKKFEEIEENSKKAVPSEASLGYVPIAPEDLKEFDFDVVLVALYDDATLCDYLEYELLLDTKNEGKKIRSIIEPTFWYVIKTLLSK